MAEHSNLEVAHFLKVAQSFVVKELEATDTSSNQIQNDC